MRSQPLALLVALIAAAPVAPYASARATAGRLEMAVGKLDALVERSPAEFAEPLLAPLVESSHEVEQAAVEQAAYPRGARPAEVLSRLQRVLEAKARVDETLERLLATRTGFASLDAGDARREALRHYLRATSQLIDLSGRLRYTLRDAIASAATVTASDAGAYDQLLGLLAEYRSSIGMAVVAPSIFELYPAPEGTPRVATETKLRLLRMIAASGNDDLLPFVASLVVQPRLPPQLVIEAAETIRQIGLPQDPRPGQDPELPPPPITPHQLYDTVSAVNASGLSGNDAQRHAELSEWLRQRVREGVTEPAYRIGRFEVQPGDWLLMRNPSPYNRFTDLSPGLFTHVGVVAAETGADGVRRIVLVDLPERGTDMPATNVETFLKRSLHYVFLRHDDPEVGRAMGRVAASLIGNETQFDLNFRTDRVRALKGQPLEGQKIHTYCAGLLLLCAQETSAAEEEFFPIEETAAGGKTLDNLEKLGLSIGDHFISPTGAIFSQRMQLVGRREPMYEPTREIEERVFDHFAVSLAEKTLVPSQTWYQSLRVSLAQAAKVTPLLGRALARANDVSPDIDLVAAARAAAVVETLDEIAYGASGEFLDAREALLAGPIDELRRQGASRDDIRRVQELRNRHATLYQRWIARQLSPRQLREALVEYYARQGERELDARFFQSGN